MTSSAARPPRSDLAHHWTLDPAVTFLNHGSFGACPGPVLAGQAELRARLERNPVQFLVRELQPLLDGARAELGAFLGADLDDLAFVPNATAGVNAVLRSLSLQPGDELLTTDHEYRASRNALDFVAGRAGARVVVVPLPFPLTDPAALEAALLAAVGPRTRLALLDHVTSPTALVLPLERIVPALQARGVDVLVDGAHAPGMLPLDLQALGAAYYTGNCHKWMCAPKGAAFLHVRRDRQAGVRPLAISHGAGYPLSSRSRFRIEFDWTGTADPTPFLSVPLAISFLGGLLPGGWEEVRRRNRELALQARRTLCQALQVAPPCPDELLGSMATVPLPDGPGAPPSGSPLTDSHPLGDRLLNEAGIVVPVVAFPGPPRRAVRVSAQLYNAPEEYAWLASELVRILAEEPRRA